MVEDGAICTMSVQNTTGELGWLQDKPPILHINYTIFHGDKTSMDQNPVIIFSGQTKTQDTINFRILPNCYLEKLLDYVDFRTVYIGTTPAKDAMYWLMDDKNGNSQCNNPFFIERYALSVISFSALLTYDNSSTPTLSPTTQSTLESEQIILTMNNISSSAPDSTITKSWVSTERQCAWPQIVCKEGSIVSLTLQSTDILSIAGSIATEIGLLTNLETLKLSTF